MNCACHKWGSLVFGLFIVIFTFIMWNPSKWVIFAIGILMILRCFFGDKCMCKPCCEVKPTAKPAPKKKK